MNELQLTYLAAALELGALTVVVGLFWSFPPLRQRLAGLLGALVIPMLVYVAVFIQWATLPTDSSIQWAVAAVWEMTFAPFVATLLAGAALAFVPRPKQVWWRVAVGFICAPLGYALLIGVAKFVQAA